MLKDESNLITESKIRIQSYEGNLRQLRCSVTCQYSVNIVTI